MQISERNTGFRAFVIAKSNIQRVLAANVLLWLIAFSLAPLRGQPVALPDEKFWVPNGPVNSIVTAGDTIYIGGDFSYVGPRTGPAASFAIATGDPLGAPPKIEGTVRAVVPDGEGGWFVGGVFTMVGDVGITNIAHLNADLSLNSAWNPQIVGASVNCLAIDGNRLYIGGQFTKVGGLAVNALVGVNTENAAIEWNPHVTGSAVNALDTAGGIVYAGGNFSAAGGANRLDLAAIRIDNAQATAWNPGADNQVFALAVEGNTVYVGGQFNNTGTKPRARLAAIDITTGVAGTWNPNPNGLVRALVVANGTVYAGGDFTTISVASRRGVAAVDAVTGAAGALDLQLQGGPTVNLVRSLFLNGDVLYVGGQFTGALQETHVMEVGVDLITGDSVPTPRASEFNGLATAAYGVNAMAVANGLMFLGGDFTSFGGVARQRAAALSLVTGAVLSWSPSFDAPVLSMIPSTAGVFVGGSFTNVNTSTKTRGLALIDGVSGAALDFPFAATNGASAVVVRSLAIQNNTLYVGGAFTVVTNASRRFVVAVNATSGAVFPGFDAKLGGGSVGVNSLLVAGDNLYVAGDFATVNGTAMARLTAVSTATGAAANWNPKPSPNQPVNELATDGERLYAGGGFTTISGVTLRGLAVYNVSDNSLVPLDATLASGATVNALAATPNTLYVGGTFAVIGGENRRNLGGLSANTGSAHNWNPSPDVSPSVITLSDGHVFTGGGFRSVSGDVNGFFAAFARGGALATVRKGANLEITGNYGDRVEGVLQTSPSLRNPTWTDLSTNVAGFPTTSSVPIGAGAAFYRVVAR